MTAPAREIHAEAQQVLDATPSIQIGVDTPFVPTECALSAISDLLTQRDTARAEADRMREAMVNLVDVATEFVGLVRGSGPRPPRISDALDLARSTLQGETK